MDKFDKELIHEGRACLTNAILAYGEGFKILAPEEINEDLMEDIADGIVALETMMPVIISLWEADQTLSGRKKSFAEFIAELGKRYDGGDQGFGLSL